MNCRWILSVMLAAPVAWAQQSSGGNTRSGTVGAVLPQVAPGMQQNNNNGRGISFVTRRTPTATTAIQARGFFAAGGVNLGGAAVGSGGGSVGGVEDVPITAGVHRRPVALPTEAELSRTAAAAQRGDPRAQARLAEYRRILTGADPTPASVPAQNVSPSTSIKSKPVDKKRQLPVEVKPGQVGASAR